MRRRASRARARGPRPRCCRRSRSSARAARRPRLAAGTGVCATTARSKPRWVCASTSRPLVDVGAPVGEGRHHLGVAQRQEGLRPEEARRRARRERHELLGVRCPQLAVDGEVVLEEAPAIARAPASAARISGPPSSGRRRRARSCRGAAASRTKRSTKATVAALPASSSATTRSVRVVGEVPRHAEEREPVAGSPRPAAARPGSTRLPARTSSRDRRRADPVDDDARAALRHVVLRRDERQRGRVAPHRQAQLLRSPARGASSHVRARSATTRTIASPSCELRERLAPHLDPQLVPRARARPTRLQGGGGRCSLPRHDADVAPSARPRAAGRRGRGPRPWRAPTTGWSAGRSPSRRVADLDRRGRADPQRRHGEAGERRPARPAGHRRFEQCSSSARHTTPKRASAGVGPAARPEGPGAPAHLQWAAPGPYTLPGPKWLGL